MCSKYLWVSNKCVPNVCHMHAEGWPAQGHMQGAVKMGLAYFTNGISPKKWWYVENYSIAEKQTAGGPARRALELR